MDSRHADASTPDPPPEVLTAVLEAADLAWFEVDPERRVRHWSAGMERLTGFPATEVVGLPCVVGIRCDRCLAGCPVYAGRTVQDVAITLYRKDGERVAVRKTARVLRGPGGDPIGAIEVYRADDSAVEREPPEDPERRALREALERHRYRRHEAAVDLGISRTTLWRKMKRHGLDR